MDATNGSTTDGATNTMSTNADTIDSIPPMCFWQDASAACTRHAVTLLEMAGQPATNENILRVVEGLPRSREQLADERWLERSYCNSCLFKVYRGEGKDDPRYREMFHYFFDYFPDRHPDAQRLVVSAFRAILGTLGRETFAKHHEARELAELIREVMAGEFMEWDRQRARATGPFTWLKGRHRRAR